MKMSTNECLIKRMSEEHIHSIAELEKICFSEPWSENSLREEIDNKDAFFIVVADGDKVLAYGGMHISFGECYVDNIAVLPEERGKGLGEKITKALLNEAESYGEFFTLEVRESNIPAVKLYEKLGLETVGVRKNFYRNPTENALIMTLNFNK